MKQRKSLRNAIAQTKRNYKKYSVTENLMDAYYTNYLIKDDLETLINCYNKWARKNYKKEANYSLIKSALYLD